VLRNFISSLMRRRRKTAASESQRRSSGVAVELLETRAMLTALPIAGWAGARDVDHFPTVQQFSHDRADPTPQRPDGAQHGPGQRGDHGSQNAAQQHRQPNIHVSYLIGPTPAIRYSSFVVTPRPGLQYHVVLLPLVPSSQAPRSAQNSTIDPAPSAAVDATFVTPLESTIGSTLPTGAGPEPTPSLTALTRSTWRDTLLPEGEGTSASAYESVVETSGALDAGRSSLPSDAAAPFISNVVSPNPADSDFRPDEVTPSDIPSVAVTAGAVDMSASDRAYVLSVFDLTSVSALDAVALAYVEPSNTSLHENPASDFAFAADTWDATERSRDNAAGEPVLSERERLSEIAESWHDRINLESRIGEDNDENDSERDDTDIPLAGPDSPDPRRWIAFPERLAVFKASNREQSSPSADKADDEPARSDDATEPHMIEIAYRDPASPQEPTGENARTDSDAPGVSHVASIELIKTDGACARYQAFEVAAQPAQTVPHNENVAADAGNGASRDKEKPTPEDVSA